AIVVIGVLLVCGASWVVRRRIGVETTVGHVNPVFPVEVGRRFPNFLRSGTDPGCVTCVTVRGMTVNDAMPAPAPVPSAGPQADGEVDALLIGRRVRHLRTSRGMTLEELGAAVGRAASQISVLENGHRE